MTQKIVTQDKATQQRLIIGVIIAAITIAVVGIVLSSGSGLTSSGIAFDQINQFRTEDGGFVLGRQEAPFTLVVFEDFRCPHCQSYESELDQFVREFVVTGKAQIEFRMLRSASPTPLMFQLAQCVEEIQPNSFWKGRELLFTMAKRGFNDTTSPRQFATDMGIDYSKVLDCVPQARQYQVDQEIATATQVSGTPTVLVRYNNSPLQPSPVGPRPTIAQLRDLMRQFE